jgi:hypothetical protein
LSILDAAKEPNISALIEDLVPSSGKKKNMHVELSNGGGTFSVATQLPSQGHGEGSGSSASTGMGLVTPFDLPLTPYTSDDQPWVWNIRHMTPDCKGNVWTPP